MNTQALIKTDSFFYLRKELWNDVKEYRDDYKSVIKSRESHRIAFLHQSPQIYHRNYLLKHLKNLCSNKKLSICCTHLAVYIMDIFMDNHSIDFEKLLLIPSVSLLLSAKIEESSNLVKIADLNESLEKPYTLDEFKALELMMLKFFNWYVMFPTAAHYTHYFMQAIITQKEADNIESFRGISLRNFIMTLNDKMRIYLDKIIDDVHFMHFSPSKLAAGIISASRLQMELSPWTTELTQFTGYCKYETDIILCSLLQ